MAYVKCNLIDIAAQKFKPLGIDFCQLFALYFCNVILVGIVFKFIAIPIIVAFKHIRLAALEAGKLVGTPACRSFCTGAIIRSPKFGTDLGFLLAFFVQIFLYERKACKAVSRLIRKAAVFFKALYGAV